MGVMTDMINGSREPESPLLCDEEGVPLMVQHVIYITQSRAFYCQYFNRDLWVEITLDQLEDHLEELVLPHDNMAWYYDDIKEMAAEAYPGVMQQWGLSNND